MNHSFQKGQTRNINVRITCHRAELVTKRRELSKGEDKDGETDLSEHSPGMELHENSECL